MGIYTVYVFIAGFHVIHDLIFKEINKQTVASVHTH